MNLEFYLERLKGMLKQKRLIHSLGVMDTAVRLAKVHGANIEQAALAGLLHDCARGLSGEELIELAKKFEFSMNPVDLALPVLLHAPVGALLAKREFGVQNETVLRSIEVHTLGDEYMTVLDKVVFVADKVEPGRQFQNVAKLRALAERDLDRALLNCYDMSISYALRLGDPVHPQMVTARNKLVFSRPDFKI